MGKSSSKSQADVITTTTNRDERIVNGNGMVFKDIGGGGFGSRTTVNVTDGGIVKDGLATVRDSVNGSLASMFGTAESAFKFGGDTVERALKTVELSDATNAEGFSNLLNLADKFVSASNATGERLAMQTQNSVMDAYRNAKTDSAGAIDQKTIIVIVGAAAAVGIAIVMRKK